MLATLAILFAAAAAVHGADALPKLKVSENNRFIVTEDGAPFFWLGDTAWELFTAWTKKKRSSISITGSDLATTSFKRSSARNLTGKRRAPEGFLPFGPDPKE